jgi:hypothetical protein
MTSRSPVSASPTSRRGGVPRARVVGCLAAALLTAAAWRPVEAADWPQHPRLVLTSVAEARVRERVGRDPTMALVRDATLATATAMLDRRTCEYRIPDGKRLLSESRHALGIVLHSAAAWRLTGERRFFDRCRRELDAACALPDWNPSHFLDVAEMATAVAIGLDWLYVELPDDARRRYREALEAKAIGPAREQFARGRFWTTARNNWSQVCCAGIALASAATAESETDLAATPFDDCLRVIEASDRFYAPDGGYPEGPAYWDYGTAYHVLGLAVAEDLGRKPAISRPLLDGARFMTHMRGPTGTFFNFADARPSTDQLTPARGWLITRAADEALAVDLREGLLARSRRLLERGADDRFFALHLAWLPEEPRQAPPLPDAAAFRGEQPVALMRTSWQDPRGIFIGAKGGTPKASHGHMDCGSFVVEALGRRWIHDLGGDNYNLPGYFGTTRWNYYRLNARSHNVLLIGDAMQDPTCEPCPLVEARCDEPPYSATFDLGPAYVVSGKPLAKTVRRTVSLDPKTRAIRIRDEVEKPVADVRWQCLIDVTPDLDANRAVLSHGADAIGLEIRPGTARWNVEPAIPPTPEERRNEGFRMLFCTIPAAERLEIEVTITPRPTLDGK